jgi:putative membrane protein
MHRNEFVFWTGLVALVSVVTFIGTHDRINWLLDAGWVAVGVPLLLLTRQRFPLTPLLYRLLVIHALVLIAGGYWTYEANPLGEWWQAVTGSSRNHYDRLGHFLQGFVPAIIFRELLVRTSPVTRGPWLAYFVITSCLAFSVCFEFAEWWATLLSGDDANNFLGHQGDIWDAQWDMLWALIGAVAAVLLLSRCHDRELKRLAG